LAARGGLANRRVRERAAFIAAFLAPAVLLYAGFVVWPLLQALGYSAYRWRGVSTRRTFVGLGNFEKLWADKVFWTSVQNNVLLLLGAGLGIFVLSIAVAHAIRSPGRTAGLVRATILFPQMVSTVIVAVLWQFILNPRGLLNAGLRRVGLDGLAHTWLGEKAWALPSVGLAFVWAALGFYVLMFAAGLQAIPAEVNEAAALDGSTGWDRFRRITFPLLTPVTRVAAAYLVINVMNVFALPFLMTRGGPDRASETMLTYLYEQAFTNGQFGYATAVAVGNFAVVMAVTIVVLVAFRRDPTGARR
jgi:ABC-type sugar transport system permease subunit